MRTSVHSWCGKDRSCSGSRWRQVGVSDGTRTLCKTLTCQPRKHRGGRYEGAIPLHVFPPSTILIPAEARRVETDTPAYPPPYSTQRRMPWGTVHVTRLCSAILLVLFFSPTPLPLPVMRGGFNTVNSSEYTAHTTRTLTPNVPLVPNTSWFSPLSPIVVVCLPVVPPPHDVVSHAEASRPRVDFSRKK